MKNRDKTGGITGLPVVLIICISLAALTLIIGAKGLDVAERLKGKQETVSEFRDFLEVCTDLSNGEIGDKRTISLTFQEGVISIRGNLVQLRRGGEVSKSHYLPLFLIKNEKRRFEIEGGTYKLTLTRKNAGKENIFLFLRMTEVKNE